MCRFVVYKGREILMSDLLLNAEQSLVMQSYRSKEREEPLNGDGFGIGWYSPEIDPTPCVFTSIQPAWSNRNLFRLSEKIKSSCFFAHVRAASPGSFVNELNCHPFQYEQFLWMHNGYISEFQKIKRILRESLDSQFYDLIQGTTDSEHAFALFLNFLGNQIASYSTNDLSDALIATIDQISGWQREQKATDHSHLNFAISDGNTIVVSRYTTSTEVEPPTLYYSSGDRVEVREGKYNFVPTKKRANAIIIASEPLTSERANWTRIPKNHLIIITPELHIHQVRMD